MGPPDLQVVDFPATFVEASVRLLTALLTLGRIHGRLAGFLALMRPGLNAWPGMR